MNVAAKNAEPEWLPVQLLFTRLVGAKKGDWSLFLCADPSLPANRVLEIYKLRWSVEVYFKEVKQNMGFLKEQTGDYVCHSASVHLAALRYLMFSHLLLEKGGKNPGEIRERFSKNIETISFGYLLTGLYQNLLVQCLNNPNLS